MFINFKDIDIDVPGSWKGQNILTFDIDWAIDEVILNALELVEKAQVKATFFVTHKTPLLDKLRLNPKIELGIHPNFNLLIDKDPRSDSAEKTLSEIKKVVPEAQVIRSHSMTHSGRWLALYDKFEIKYSSQYYMGGVNIIQPSRHVNGIVEVPVYFADDGYIFVSDHNGWKNPSMEELCRNSELGIKVFNFHPIHIALNTNSFFQYDKTREAHTDFTKLTELKNNALGVESILKKIINIE